MRVGMYHGTVRKAPSLLATLMLIAIVVGLAFAGPLAASGATPGGIGPGADFWLRADRGTGATVDGAPIASWIDQAIPANTVTQGTAAAQPLYEAAGPNFNPALRFANDNGASPRWFQTNIDTYYQTPGKAKYSYWAVAVPSPTRAGFMISSEDTVPSGGSYDRWISYASGSLQGTTGQAYSPVVAGGATAGIKLIRIYYNQGVANGSSGWVAGVNGLDFTSTMDDTAAPLTIGALVPTGVAPYRGTIAEAVGVAGDSNDDPVSVAKVQSYLAAKYGITLGDTDNQPGANNSISYVDSAGTTYWTGSAVYQNNVTVIATDAASDFDQRVSQTSSVSTLPVTLASGSYDFSGVITPTSPSSPLADLSAVAIGDNNGSTAITANAASGVTRRMSRVWAVQTTGAAPTQLSVRVPASAISLPADGRGLYAVSSADENFSTAGATATQLTRQGAYYIGVIPTPADGEFLTFGTRVATASTSTIAANPTQIPADGSSTSTITLTLRDAHGDPVGSGGGTVTIPINAGTGTISAVTDNGDGTYTAVLTAPTTLGTAVVGFTVNGQPGTATATVTFAGPPSTATSTVVAAPTTILDDGQDSSTVTVTLYDAAGTPVGAGGNTVVITTTLGTISAVTDNGDGTYTATLMSTAAGTALLGFTVEGAEAIDTAQVIVQDTTVPAPPVINTPSDGSVVISRPTITGTGEPGATVTVRDAAGAPICEASVAPDGTWTCDSVVDLPEGPTTLTASQIDQAGNASADSNSVRVIVPSPPTPAPIPPSPSAQGTSSMLAVTGSGAINSVVVIAIGLVVVGLLLTARRRVR